MRQNFIPDLCVCLVTNGFKTKVCCNERLERNSMVNKTSVSNFKVKNTPLKRTDGKAIFKIIFSFLQVDKGRLFRLYKIVLRGI